MSTANWSGRRKAGQSTSEDLPDSWETTSRYSQLAVEPYSSCGPASRIPNLDRECERAAGGRCSRYGSFEGIENQSRWQRPRDHAKLVIGHAPGRGEPA